jgi:hypothetical protein
MLLSVTTYGQTAINSVPFTITSPGNYFLNTYLVYPPLTGIAISINSSNVTLDFAGRVLAAHWLTASSTSGFSVPPIPSSATAIVIGLPVVIGVHGPPPTQMSPSGMERLSDLKMEYLSVPEKARLSNRCASTV